MLAVLLLAVPAVLALPGVPLPSSKAMQATAVALPVEAAWANDVTAAPDGSLVYVTGRVLEPFGVYDARTVAYDAATGSVRWTATYHPAEAISFDTMVGSAASPDGKLLLVTGYSGVAGGGSGIDAHTDMLTLAYEAATGKLLWETRYHGPRPNSPWAGGQQVTISKDSKHVFVVGLTYPEGVAVNALAFNFTTLALDAATGKMEWAATYNGPGNVEDWGYALALTPDQRHVVVTGRSYGGTFESWDYATLSYDAATGREEWVRRYDSGAKVPVALPYGLGLGDWPSSVGTAQGKVFVTGRSQGDGTSYDYATVAYDQELGRQLWVARYDGPGHLEDGAYALGVSPDGQRVFVTGWSNSGSPDLAMDYATVAYDANTGEQVWVQRFDGSGNALLDDAALALRVAPDGKAVFVSGWSFDSKGAYGYATVAYDAATGERRWVARAPGSFAGNADVAARFNGEGDDLDLASLALSPEGSRVYFAGTAPNLSFELKSYDAATGHEQWASARGHARSHEGPSAQAFARAPGIPEAAFVCALLGVALLRRAAARRL